MERGPVHIDRQFHGRLQAQVAGIRSPAKLAPEEEGLGGESIRPRFELSQKVIWEQERRTAVEKVSLTGDELVRPFVKPPPMPLGWRQAILEGDGSFIHIQLGLNVPGILWW